MASQVPVLGECVAGQPLFFIQLGQPVVELRAAGIEFLHLFVDGDRLQVESGFGVMPGDSFILLQGLLRRLRTAEEFCQFLPVANVFRVRFDNLLVVLDSLADLPFLQVLLGRD